MGSALAYTSTPAVGTDATSHVITPSSALPGGTTCQVTVVASKVHDADLVDAPDTLTANYVFSFTTLNPVSIVTIDPSTSSNDGTDSSVKLIDGVPVVAFVNTNSDDIKLTVCNDANCSSYTTRTIDSTVQNGYPSLAISPDGKPVISYWDAGVNRLYLAICADAACSSSTIVDVLSGGVYPSLAITSDGKPVISYGGSGVIVTACDDAACSTKTTRTVDAASNIITSTSLALTPDGKPVIGYMDVSGKLKLAICGDATCSTSTVRTLGTFAGATGQRPVSVALNGDIPVVSFFDPTGADLKVAVCSDAVCTSSTITLVDSSGSVGQFSWVAINGGNPVISYYDGTSGDLKLAVCNDATCTTRTITTVDSVDTVGEYSSLALNNGKPVISYRDRTINKLRLAICANATCGP
jgi:hypothetical protein